MRWQHNAESSNGGRGGGEGGGGAVWLSLFTTNHFTAQGNIKSYLNNKNVIGSGCGVTMSGQRMKRKRKQMTLEK